MSKDSIKVTDISFAYHSDDGENYINERKAIDGLSLEIKRGSYTALLGPNGSGKSTLAKLLDVLELPDEGSIVVFGDNTKDENNFWTIREKCACVFQNPDNQIVGTIVEEDVAFGPENLGVPNPMLRERVEKALKDVGLYEFKDRQAAYLSGGQKQKLAIAGALAMEPQILILDEATAMLDPQSRDEFLDIVEKMREKNNLTLITITHDMYEASRCEKIFIISEGKVALSGTPEEIFSNVEEIKNIGLCLPESIDLCYEIKNITNGSLTKEDLVSEEKLIQRTIENLKNIKKATPEIKENHVLDNGDKPVLKIENLSCSYDENNLALKNANLTVNEGEILAVVGRSGCGKTTLISHMNAILRPQTGDVKVLSDKGVWLSANNKKDIMDIRSTVGLVFQYPEYQLFEETVYKDICYGLTKMKLDLKEQKTRVMEAAKKVGLDENLLDKSPFELSGGQKRRVAMAGVLVMRPKVLVLDEPASGLDPRGRLEMFDIIHSLKASGTTVILVSHNMDEASRNADRICVIKDGEIQEISTPKEIFSDREKVTLLGLKMPMLTLFSDKLKEKIKEQIPEVVFEEVSFEPKKEAINICDAVGETLC